MDECIPPSEKKFCLDDDQSVPSSCVVESAEPPKKVEEGAKFAKRRKFAVLLSYCGKGYMGMQKNPDVPTIEEDLLAAMKKALAFPEGMENDLAKLKFQRCARTDKGVSAARQLVSLKMVDLKDSVALINAHLPPQIRVMSVKRVTKSFDSRHACVARRYEYLIPTYAFAPYHQSTPDYRLPDTTLSLVNKLLAHYEGTHNYHNFTSGKKFSDMSSNRYIMSFKSGDRVVGRNSVQGGNGKEMEFMPLTVKGQSFVLHQIRKMIGFVIAIVRGLISEAEFERVFLKEKVDIPKAPALGLLLDNVYFDRYNARFCNSGERPKLEWQEVDAEICQFKIDYIHRTIIETEIKEMSLMAWLHTLQLHNFHETATRLKNAESAKEGERTNDKSTELPVADTDTPDSVDVSVPGTDTASQSSETTADIAGASTNLAAPKGPEYEASTSPASSRPVTISGPVTVSESTECGVGLDL